MPPFIDLRGKKFNRLTILRRVSNKGKHIVWQCQCDCGNINEVRAFALKDGSTLSCGCFHKENTTRLSKTRLHKSISPAVRFEKFYIPEPNSGCWLWLGAVDKQGYGIFDSNRAHRFSFWLHKNEITEGFLIRHTCDNPTCVNPDHLLSGTGKDNSNDARERNRLARGEKINTVKLNEAQVQFIRESSEPPRNIRKQFGISNAQIWNIRTKRSWKHVK